MRFLMAQLGIKIEEYLMLALSDGAGSGAVIAVTPATQHTITDPGDTLEDDKVTPAARSGGSSSRGRRFYKSEGLGHHDPEPIDATGDGIPLHRQFDGPMGFDDAGGG